MKVTLKYVVLSLAVIALLAACAKPPTQEMNDTQAAITAVMGMQAEKYTPEEAKALNDKYQSAVDEVKLQEQKFWKNFDKAKQILAQAKADAENLKGLVEQKKEEAKKAAIAAAEAAKVAVEEAKAILAKAPKGKDTRADVEAMTADLAAAEAALPELQNKINAEDFFGASDQANSIKDKAAGITAQVNAAIEAKKGKKK